MNILTETLSEFITINSSISQRELGFYFFKKKYILQYQKNWLINKTTKHIILAAEEVL